MGLLHLHLILSICILSFVCFLPALSGNTKWITRNGKVCKTDCSKNGESYYWCRTRDDDWGKCSYASERDIYGGYCYGFCQQSKKSITTCETSGKYCGLVHTSGCKGDILKGSSATTLRAAGAHTDGDWGNSEYCPPNEFVIGFQLLLQPFQGLGIGAFDDQGLVGIKFFCANSWKNVTNPNCYITSDYLVANQAYWTEKKFCSGGFANGFELKTLGSQKTWDDHGATNFKLHCSNPQELTFDISNEPGEAEWPKGPTRCPEKQAICGLKTKIESNHRDDNTGLNAVDVYCCERVGRMASDIAKECSPELHWRKVAYSDNRLGTTSKKYTYTERIGASRTETLRNLQKDSTTSGRDDSWGIENVLELGSELFTPGVQNTLTAKFEQTYSTSTTKEDEKENVLTSAFEKETTHQVEIEILPGVELSLYQFVGVCGPFVVYPNMFNRSDVQHAPNPGHENGQPTGSKMDSTHQEYLKSSSSVKIMSVRDVLLVASMTIITFP